MTEEARSRFKTLSAKLAAKGAKNPDALAAHIGNKKYGKAGMAALAAKGRKKKKGANSAMYPRECFRDMPFQLQGSDGLNFEGYAAVYNSPTKIKDWEGEFEEQIQPGAFKRSLEERTPVLMFEHGKHPLIGTLPLGVITDIREDMTGLFIQARLTDNWLVQPVRDAVRDGAIRGMSFRFSVPDGGDSWLERDGELPLRTLIDVDMPELGPVVFPAYKPTTASVRSILDGMAFTEVQQRTILALVKEGFTPESAIAAVTGQNMTLLKHTGLVSVQLQPLPKRGDTSDPAVRAAFPQSYPGTSVTWIGGSTAPVTSTSTTGFVTVTNPPTNFTGRSDARSTDGGDGGATAKQDDGSGHPAASEQFDDPALRDGVLRVMGLLPRKEES